MKRLIAYSSVGHMGFVMLGIATMNEIGINAALIGMVAHGLITGLLFFIAGSMAHRYHTRDMDRLGGQMILMPRMGFVLGFAAPAAIPLTLEDALELASQEHEDFQVAREQLLRARLARDDAVQM